MIHKATKLPRLLDAELREIARLEPSSLSLSIERDPLSTAEMTLPHDQTEIKARDFVELYSPEGSVGIFRVMEAETQPGLTQRLWLQHGLVTLSDDLAIGSNALAAPVAEVISKLLENQTIPRWKLGDCDVPADVEMVYEYSYDNLLSAVTGLLQQLPEKYVLEFDQTAQPWLMHIHAMPEDDESEMRLNRNIASMTLNVDSSEQCTRVYAFGAGEGTDDRITLRGLTGTEYLDADNQETWGVIANTFTGDDIFDALTLRDVAERYLEEHKEPRVSVEVEALALYEATGEPMDRFRVGRVCRMPLPAYGIIMRERIVSISWPDVYGAPESATVTLANKRRDATDMISSLLRDVTNSKLIGGTVETAESTYTNANVTSTNSLVHYFDITGYGNVLRVLAEYTSSSSGTIRVNVDSINDVPASEADSSVDILRYLKSDENGVPTVGEHYVQYFAPTTTAISVSSKVTVKTIEKR